jgi:hypothetical protein
MKQQGKEEMSMQNEIGKLSTVLAWAFLLILVGINVAIALNRGDEVPEANGFEPMSREEFMRAQKYPTSIREGRNKSQLSSSAESGFAPPTDSSISSIEVEATKNFRELFGGTFYESLDFESVTGFKEISELNMQWFAASLGWTMMYVNFDAEKDISELVSAASPGLNEMRTIVQALRVEVDKVPQGKYREQIEEENLRMKVDLLAAYEGLLQAAIDLDAEAETRWIEEVGSLGLQQEKFGFFVLEQMKKTVRTNPQTAKYFEAVIREIEESISAMGLQVK